MSTTQRKDNARSAKTAKKPGTRARAKAAAPAVKASAEIVVEVSGAAVETLHAEGEDMSGANMAVTNTATQERVVALSSHCSIKDAASLKSQLLALAHAPEAVAVDLGAVERVDTATMQLLCAFARDRADRQQSIEWRGATAAWHEAVRLLGVQHWLGQNDGSKA
jgi:ABC-type transporter Mla MlaB component